MPFPARNQELVSGYKIHYLTVDVHFQTAIQDTQCFFFYIVAMGRIILPRQNNNKLFAIIPIDAVDHGAANFPKSLHPVVVRNFDVPILAKGNAGFSEHPFAFVKHISYSVNRISLCAFSHCLSRLVISSRSNRYAVLAKFTTRKLPLCKGHGEKDIILLYTRSLSDTFLGEYPS